MSEAATTQDLAVPPPEPPKKKRYSGSFLAVARGEFGVLAGPRMGRPSKATPEILQAILTAVAKGSHFAPACVAAGVSSVSAKRWIEIGQEHLDRGKRSEFCLFVEHLSRAAAKAETKLVQEIHDQTPEDWRAGAFLLERRHPDRWGKKEQAQNVTNVVISDALVTQLVDSMRVAGAPALQLQPAIDAQAIAIPTDTIAKPVKPKPKAKQQLPK